MYPFHMNRADYSKFCGFKQGTVTFYPGFDKLKEMFFITSKWVNIS